MLCQWLILCQCRFGEARQLVKQVDKVQLAAIAGKEIDGLREGATHMQHCQALFLIDALKQGGQQRRGLARERGRAAAPRLKWQGNGLSRS